MRIFRGCGPALAALAWSAAPLNASPQAASVRADEHRTAAPEYSLREGKFAARPPSGWPASRDAREDERQKVYGVRFSGPRSADGVLSTISIAYYPPDNILFKGGAAEFLKRNLNGDERFVPSAGETTGPVETTTVGGLPAKRFARRTREYIPPGRIDAKQVAVVEEIEVAEAKTGFYVLEFKASEQLAAKLKPLYAHVRASVRITPANAAP